MAQAQPRKKQFSLLLSARSKEVGAIRSSRLNDALVRKEHSLPFPYLPLPNLFSLSVFVAYVLQFALNGFVELPSARSECHDEDVVVPLFDMFLSLSDLQLRPWTEVVHVSHRHSMMHRLFPSEERGALHVHTCRDVLAYV